MSDRRALKERFAAAYEEFSEVYTGKVRDARTGERPYPSHELYKDLYACAGNHGLFAAALWAYFWRLHEDTAGKLQEEHEVERENEELRTQLHQAVEEGDFLRREVENLYAENMRLRALDEAVSYVYASLYPDNTEFSRWVRRTCEIVWDEARRRLEKT